jgi:hypothetical protein
VTAELCWSRVIAGALIFSKEAPAQREQRRGQRHRWRRQRCWRRRDFTGSLTNSLVNANEVEASGLGGAPMPDGPLTLVNGDVTLNTLAGNPQIALEGGGFYVGEQQLTLTESGGRAQRSGSVLRLLMLPAAARCCRRGR